MSLAYDALKLAQEAEGANRLVPFASNVIARAKVYLEFLEANKLALTAQGSDKFVYNPDHARGPN